MARPTAFATSRPQGRRSAAVYDRILDVATTLFAQRGFSGVSMRDIAAEAGLSNQGSLYNHFPSKRALYEAVLARRVQELSQLMVVPQSVEDVDANISRLVDYLARRPYTARLIQRAAIDDGRYLGKAIFRVLRPFTAQAWRALEQVNLSLWENEELIHLAVGIYNLIFGYFANLELMQGLRIREPLSPEAVERQRRFLKRAIHLLLDIKEEPHSPPDQQR